MGASILAVITNDGWYDNTPGPEQHYQIAVARAIESRRSVARCANTGISGFILPNGENLENAATQKSIGISAILPLNNEKTFYTIYGDWLPVICSVISAIAFILSKFRKISLKK
ncbi:MAG: apolipoprotein N-acyltransferase [Bacteroidota bacterium]|nr:apolipoprotein N-acyltransferase [Bacteroidota bacterium]